MADHRTGPTNTDSSLLPPVDLALGAAINRLIVHWRVAAAGAGELESITLRQVCNVLESIVQFAPGPVPVGSREDATGSIAAVIMGHCLCTCDLGRHHIDTGCSDCPCPLDLPTATANALLESGLVVTRAEHEAALAKADQHHLEMHHAFRPEVVAEVAVNLGDHQSWDRLTTWCGGRVDTSQDPSGEYTSTLVLPNGEAGGEGSWLVLDHAAEFHIRTEVAAPRAGDYLPRAAAERMQAEAVLKARDEIPDVLAPIYAKRFLTQHVTETYPEYDPFAAARTRTEGDARG